MTFVLLIVVTLLHHCRLLLLGGRGDALGRACSPNGDGEPEVPKRPMALEHS